MGGGGGGSDGLPVGVKSKVVEGGFQLVSIEITSFAIAPLREQEQEDVGGFSFTHKGDAAAADPHSTAGDGGGEFIVDE